MLPGLRFLFAAMLICSSLLVFGMGAIALMRASHQQFASLPPRPAPEPVFAQPPQSVPSLSMLRAEPSPVAPPKDAGAEPERTAALTNAERAVEPLPPMVEPKSDAAADTRSDAMPAQANETIADPPPGTQIVPEVMPLAEKPAAPEPAAPETMPAVQPAQIASAPDVSAPEITGSVAMPEDQPVEPQIVVIDPPLPQPRPEVAALPPKLDTAPVKAAPRPIVKRKVRHARRHQTKSEKLPAVTSAPTLGSLFGGGN